MNLYDIVRRRDRMLVAPAGDVHATVLKLPAGTLRAVGMPAGARIRLRDAHQATCLQDTPGDPGWTLYGNAGATLRVLMEASDGTSHLLADTCIEATSPDVPAAMDWRTRLAARISGAPRVASKPASPLLHPMRPVRLDWPVRMPPGYDLVLTSGDAELALAVGPLRDVRRSVLPALQGRGVEVGPGSNPAVESDATRSVRYVEKMGAQEWADTYPKEALDDAVKARWAEYAIASAERLDGFEPGSLDFVFSSHVIEHLVNPLQVLQNWWNCLAPGGAIVAVVPDARYSFDLRQPLTSTDALLDQHRAGGHERTESMYARWCQHTAPEAEIHSLRARDYAIHVNYFSPCSLRAMLEVFRGMVPDPGGIHVEQFRNGKDFAFAMFKPS